LNSLYAAVLGHYGAVADPARVRDPNRKGRVENAIQYTQSTALGGRKFESLEDQNAFLESWNEKWAKTRIHGRGQRQVGEMFEEEKAFLKPLPPRGFQYYQDAIRTVCDDTTVRFDNANYAARPARIGSQVVVRAYSLSIEIRDVKGMQLIRTHPRAFRKGAVILPRDERPFNPSCQTGHLFGLAGVIGPGTATLCHQLFDREGRPGQRAMWGIVGLAKQYPARFVEQACDHAIKTQMRVTYKMIRTMTQHFFSEAVDKVEGRSDSGSTLTQKHPLIRPTSDYGDLFDFAAKRADADE
jgi:hypothetical protein